MRQGLGSRQNWATLLGAATLGALGMYFSDPERGRRRRALARDKLQHFGAAAAHGTEVATRDLFNRLTGMQARTRHLLLRRKQDLSQDDYVVAARVRAKLGRVVSHPHAIVVSVHQGRAILCGPVLAREKDILFEAVRSTSGVIDIEDRLDVHKRADISHLQGGKGSRQMRSGFMRDNWPPALRGIAMLGGGAAGAYGLVRRSPAGLALAAAGLTFFLRGLLNKPVRRLTGLRAGHRAIDLQKSIEIMAPPETVFDAWANFRNFPYFMSHVLEVRDLGEQRSHWVVQGPMGARIEWTASLTEAKRPSVLAWKTDPGSVVEHSGLIRFEPTEDGTRVVVRLSYNPPAGILGHGVAVLLGADPKQEMDDDLMRMKSFIETGVMPHDAARRSSLARHIAI